MEEASPEQLETLLQQIAAGDEAAMGALYDATVDRIYGLAVKVTRRPDLAEEVVGDVYLQAWKQAGKYNRQRATPIGWLLMICRSRALDRLRHETSATKNHTPEDEHGNLPDEHSSTPLEDLVQRELSGKVAQALEFLNRNQRQTIALAFYKGMSHQQIADYTGEPLGTVKSNIRRAQAILRNVLDRDDQPPGAHHVRQ